VFLHATQTNSAPLPDVFSQTELWIDLNEARQASFGSAPHIKLVLVDCLSQTAKLPDPTFIFELCEDLEYALGRDSEFQPMWIEYSISRDNAFEEELDLFDLNPYFSEKTVELLQIALTQQIEDAFPAVAGAA